MFWQIYICTCVAVLSSHIELASSQNPISQPQTPAPSKYLPELRIWSDQFNLVVNPATTTLAIGGERTASEDMDDFCIRIQAESPRTASPFAIGVCAAQSGDYKAVVFALRQASNNPRANIKFAAIEELVDVLITAKWSLQQIQSILDVTYADQLAAAFFRKHKFIEADQIFGWLAISSPATQRCNFFAAKSMVLTAMDLFDQAIDVAAIISNSDATCKSLAFAARCQAALEQQASITLVPFPYICAQYQNQAALRAVAFARTFASNTSAENWLVAQQYLLPYAGNTEADDSLLYLAQIGACSTDTQKQIRVVLKKLPKGAHQLRAKLTTHVQKCSRTNRKPK